MGPNPQLTVEVLAKHHEDICIGLIRQVADKLNTDVDLQGSNLAEMFAKGIQALVDQEIEASKDWEEPIDEG